jgi:hypothetical protein
MWVEAGMEKKGKQNSGEKQKDTISAPKGLQANSSTCVMHVFHPNSPSTQGGRERGMDHNKGGSCKWTNNKTCSVIQVTQWKKRNEQKRTQGLGALANGTRGASWESQSLCRTTVKAVFCSFVCSTNIFSALTLCQILC